MATQVRLTGRVGPIPPTRPRKGHSGRLGGAVYGELLALRLPRIPPARHRPSGGLPPWAARGAATVAKAREQRLTALREEALALEREAVDESDLPRALEVFDPVWAALAPREQARRLRLLIERVGYDGRHGTVTVTFRPPGINLMTLPCRSRWQR